ncbi:hypothetical protein ABB55_25115 [Prosthecomicrobium hirschii]|uniref:Copper oxidase n=2 Tax=Prosthecodimorpha hirschii TaxID=665126 RepID=A0A0P6VU84_9HYPH|nr:hypothetical protein ABB55_25115 [Prosthecomicrobium hirschii]
MVMPGISRRTLLRGALAAGGAGLMAGGERAGDLLTTDAAAATPWRSAPEPGPGRLHEITFEAAEREMALFGPGDAPVRIWSYADKPFPVVRVSRGDRIRAEVHNRLPEHVSVHWHGLRIPNAMDGVQYLTQPPIQTGERFTYDFAPPDPGTFFFHPHCNESGQVGRGLAGIMVVEGDERVKPDGELILAVKDWRLGPDGRWLEFSTPQGASRGGTFGTRRSTNDQRAFAAEVPAAADLRVRLLNLDSSRVMEIGIEGAAAAIVAVDGHAVRPIPLDRSGQETWRMGPAMRLDLLVRTPKPGAVAKIVDYQSAEPWTVAALAATGKPRRRGALDADILYRPVFPEPDLAHAETLSWTFMAASDSVASFADAAGSDPAQRLLMDSLCVSERTYWAINKLSWPNAADRRLPPPLGVLTAGRTYRFELVNATPHPHPIHLHGHVFRVVSSSERARMPAYAADTVLLSPKERVEIAFVATAGDWMFHCHILEHLETGMMGYLRVV